MNDSCDSGLFIEFIKYVGAQHSNELLIKLSALCIIIVVISI